jgi:thymidine phosphorylase
MAKMQAIIDAQGRNSGPPGIGRFCHEVAATESGHITAIDNRQLAHIARLAGAPMDKGAGVDLHKKLGDSVEAGELLYCIYAEFPADFEFARDSAQQNSGFTTGDSYVDKVP